MVVNGNLSGPLLNENSLVNIIKLDLAKYDISTQNYVRDNQSEFINAIDTVLNAVRHLRIPCNADNTVSFDFIVSYIRSFNTNIHDVIAVASHYDCVQCLVPGRYFYRLDDSYDLQVKLVNDIEARKQFLDKLQKTLVSALPVKDVSISPNYNVHVEFDYDVYIKRFTHDFSQLAIAYLSKFGIKARAIPTSKGVQITMEAEDLLQKLSKK